MLKITAIGNLTNDIELKKSETTGVPYVILRIASDRIYRDKDGNQITDFISIKAHGRLAERCVEFAWKGCRLAAVGDFETVPTKEETEQPRLLHPGTRRGIPVTQKAQGREGRRGTGLIWEMRSNL